MTAKYNLQLFRLCIFVEILVFSDDCLELTSLRFRAFKKFTAFSTEFFSYICLESLNIQLPFKSTTGTFSLQQHPRKQN